jgi:tRNA(His) 5'-end guanylyltransferase
MKQKEKSKDDLGDRMKGYYEDRSKTRLLRRMPVVIRVDGKSFSTFCKRFVKPFDQELNDMLNNVMVYLCGKIQGAKFAERHSDEISILVTDYDTLQTDAFFDYEVEKICSITASLAATEFCKQLISSQKYLTVREDWPIFDSRCFNIPEKDVVNYFYWRHLDARRNSISMLAQSRFSHKQLIGINCKQQQAMLLKEFSINWNDLPQERKTGFICVKQEKSSKVNCGPNKGDMFVRRSWVVSPSPYGCVELRKVINDILPANKGMCSVSVECNS